MQLKPLHLSSRAHPLYGLRVNGVIISLFKGIILPLFTYLLSLFGHNGPYFTLYDLQMKAILDPSLSEYPHLLFHSETSSTKSS